MNLAERLESVHQIFLDTAPVIYFVEKNPDYWEKSQVVFSHLDEGKFTAVVSPITLSECLVIPYRLEKAEVAQVFTDLLVNSEHVLFVRLTKSLPIKPLTCALVTT